MRALGRSRASSDLEGFVKIIADKNLMKFLSSIIGARAADLIIEGVTAMEFRASCEDFNDEPSTSTLDSSIICS